MPRIAIVAFLLFLLSPGLRASAQTTGVYSDGFRQSTIQDTSLLHRGRMEFMLNLAGAISFNHSTDDENTSRQMNAFANPAFAFGYMLHDRIALRVDLGYRLERTSVQGERLQNTHAASSTIQALYHAPLEHGLAIYAGLGLGGYFGWTLHPAQEEGMLITHTTVGAIGQVLAGILIQPGPHVMLRTGLRVEGTYGVELGESAGSTDIRSGNVHVGGEFAIGVRFGNPR